MPRGRRLYALALLCALVVAALLFVGGRAWATATVHRTEARCGRPAVVGHARASHSWRAQTLRVAGCGAWRQVHGRMHHHRRH